MMTCVKYITPIAKLELKLMLKSSFCDYGDAHILVKGTKQSQNMAAPAAVVNNADEKLVFKKCAPLLIA